MELVKENDKPESESRFRLFRVKQSFIVFERSPERKLPVRMRIFNGRGNQELNTQNRSKIALQLQAIGSLYSDIEDEDEPEESLEFIEDYNDPKLTTKLIRNNYDKGQRNISQSNNHP